MTMTSVFGVAKMLRGIMVFLALMMLTQPAYALLARCSVSASGVDFGDYDVFALAPTDSTGTITVTCEGLVIALESYTIKIGRGGGHGDFSSRTMNSGSHALLYNLYTDPAYTTVWGDGTGVSSVVSDSYLIGLFTVTRNYTVYGRIPAGQDASVGNYSDTLIVTVNYL